ncbi:hypothetical protein [Aulosira sp. FACHB-615]|uniref:hypothetical protein n=1 Tax=Aulosira sp. FACHB-615 TaxID=2692777 RepID=UPI0016890D55|nr:hypothetical protein [Aulosira sp. FACHB-615]MBD2492531.1 hypothetical protein [Aulosira sp. FACHB-615]
MWISANNPPDGGGLFLIVDSEDIYYLAVYQDGEWIETPNYRFVDASWWMPLPSVPKKNQVKTIAPGVEDAEVDNMR